MRRSRKKKIKSRRRRRRRRDPSPLREWLVGGGMEGQVGPGRRGLPTPWCLVFTVRAWRLVFEIK